MTKLLLASALSASLLGCAVDQPTLGTNQGDTFEDWKAKLGREPGTGHYILDWDIVIPADDDARLYGYWESYQQGALSIHQVGGADAKWSDTQKINLTYCIGASFGANKNAIVQAMSGATVGGWEKFANIKFVYVPAQDATCNAQNTNVLFDVNQVNSGGQYLARAFFPNDGRANRNVLVDTTAFDPAQTGNIPLTNIIIHELGHTLGFRHEHIRSDQGRTVQCPEDNAYRGITPYDVVSTMHYPQCGSPNNTLALSPRDQQGVALIYGAPAGQTSPVASIQQPANNSTVPPSFTVDAMIAGTNIQKAELSIDNTPYGAAVTVAPYVFNVTNLAVGMHVLTVKATNAAGQTATTQVNITVSASGGPGTGPGTGPGGGEGEGSNDVTGGCSSSGGSAGLLFGLGLLGLAIRRRR